MFHKLVRDNNWVSPIWITDYGNYNKIPTPYRRANKDELYHQCHIAIPQGMEFRQVYLEEIPSVVDLNIIWFYDKAFGIVLPRKWTTDTGLPSQIKYIDRPVIFKIGCDHVYKQIDTLLNISTLHRGKCKKCGLIYNYDSSD